VYNWDSLIEARHASTRHICRLFDYDHLPEGSKLRTTSKMFHGFMQETVRALGDGPELTVGLRKLLEAKDCAVRQALLDERS
jgi:hypothetical protein